MSQENVEVVRRWLAVRSGSAEETLAAIAEFLDPDVIEDHLTLKGALRGLGLEGETLEAAGLKE